MKVAIQGIQGAFHHVAALKYFGDDIEIVECLSFQTLCNSLRDGYCDRAMMAIENSIAGSILTNYSLLEQYDFSILGEIYLRIKMNLIATEGTNLENLTTVESHPMALAQCQDFLSQYPYLKLLESHDTAESILSLRKKEIGYGALGSELAARVYGLKVLNPSVETNKQNYTRFLVISKERELSKPIDANKATIRFETPHIPGSLLKVLQIFESFELNMTKIQSVPILGHPSRYSFHCDLTFKNKEMYDSAINEALDVCSNLMRFGEYRKGDIPGV